MPKSAFYAMPKVELPPGKTDTDFVLGLLRAKGVLTVYGSGFGTALEDGFFRIVFLASLAGARALFTTMSQTSPKSSDPRSLIRYGPAASRSRSSLLWTLYLVRGPLLLIYVCALFATGLAPLVRSIERQRVRAISSARVPRAAAILVIYATVIGTSPASAPPWFRRWSSSRRSSGRSCPSYMDAAQQQLRRGA